ncbi:MAG: M23 family metallopeptidase [Pseudomonadota bacterium]
MRHRHLLFCLCAPALAVACSSKNSAPVVYGSQPTWQGRVYTSPHAAPPRRVAGYRAPQGSYQTESYAGAAPRSAVLTPIEMAALEGVPSSQHAVDSRPYGVSADAAYLEGALAGGAALDGATAGMVRVRKGDTVYAIARRTQTSPGAIIALNGMRPPYPLSVGQVIRVPRNDVAIAEAPVQRVAQAPRAVPAVHTVSTPSQSPVASGRGVYVIQSGDTLFGVSRATGVHVRELAAANNLRPPYQLSVGDRLVVPSKPILASVTPIATAGSRGAGATGDSIAIASIMDERGAGTSAAVSSRLFAWPLKGALVRRFESGVSGPRNDGINIAAPVGTPVRAAADGEVVYRGSDLDGYGNLILIRHNNDFVTAYAHNDVMLVRKGQQVRQGQIISKVGQSGSAGQPQLHFEIRQDLKAVDPLAFLQS